MLSRGICVTTLAGLVGRGVWAGRALPTEAELGSPAESACEIGRAVRIARMKAAATTDETVVNRKQARVLEALSLWEALSTGDMCKDSPGW